MQYQSLLLIGNEADVNSYIDSNFPLEPSRLNHPDFKIINLGPGEKIGINIIKDSKEFIQLRPFQSKYKILLIANSQNLTIEAQNSILKTLEEPSKNSIMILSSPSYPPLIPTIISRCNLIDLNSESEFSPLEIDDFLTKDVLGKLKWFESKGNTENKQLISKLINTLIMTFRTRLIEDPGGREGEKMLNCIEYLNELDKQLQNNVNKKLLLENLFITLSD